MAMDLDMRSIRSAEKNTPAAPVAEGASAPYKTCDTKEDPVAQSYLEVQDRYQWVKAEAFYVEHPDLAGFDNGSGTFVLGNNKDVTLSELLSYGITLTTNRYNRTQALLAAAKDLVSRLETKEVPFAQYYINNVLDNDVAALVLAAGAQRFFEDFEEGIGGCHRPLPPIDYTGVGKGDSIYVGGLRFLK